MSILLAVVEAGSLSAGARALRMPLATVSRKVAELESGLGAELVIRSARGLTLTEVGAAYLEATKRILEDVAEAERVASGEFTAPKGTLTLTAPIVFGRLHVLPVVIDFLKAHPDVNIRFEQSDRPVSLHEEHIDLAVRIGSLPDSSLMARRLGEVRQVVCASPAYLARNGQPTHPEELSDHRCITFRNLMAPDRWHFGRGREEIDVPIRSRLVVNTAEAAISAAAADLGLTRVLSYQVSDAVNDGRLVTILAPFEPEPWPVSFVYPPRGQVPQKLRAFLSFAAPRISDVLSR
ncbi:MAG: LysR family transcriptional regulator [Rhodobiaceae bacterium]|nr:LysR family transcriptional regulator [Rhodobiaceae bacterium]